MNNLQQIDQFDQNNEQEAEIIFNQQNMGIGSAVGQKIRRRRFADIPAYNINHYDSLPRQEEEVHKIREIARKSEQILFTAHTVFPFDFFPDTLTINANKIDIVNSNFFASHQTTSIPLRDIANVEVQTSPFFATLRIANIRYPLHPHTMQYLKKKDAIKAKTIIDGLLVAMSQGADISAVEPERLLTEIEKVGASAVLE